MTYDATMVAPGPFTSTQVTTPSSGSTVNSDGSNAMFINNAALLAVLTVVFPGSPKDGQVFSMSTRSAITLLTMSATPPIYGGLTSMLAAGYARYIYSSVAGAWFRFG
jgi:hypothetical protein